MERIEPEDETHRTKRSLGQFGATLPLRDARVEILLAPEAIESAAGQKALTLLVNELARMKGVVELVHVVGLGDVMRRPGVPLPAGALADGLHALVASLNHPLSSYRSELVLSPCATPTVRLRLGDAPGTGLAVGADAWRALLGPYASEADWTTSCPLGPALAASLAAAEAFKQLVEANLGPDPLRRPLREIALSALDYGTGREASVGPDVAGIDLSGWAVIGAGAGGSAALYVAGMTPCARGEVHVIEPDVHKVSNLNRYLMTSAVDVHDGRHKLETLDRHVRMYAPGLDLRKHAQPWETLDSPPWLHLVCTVDTVPARWNIQRRAIAGAEIIDGAVMGLGYVLLRVLPGGWCLECKHAFDPEYELNQRAARWGVEPPSVRRWEGDDVVVSAEMVDRLAHTQNRPATVFTSLIGQRFADILPVTECGDTPLRTNVPSQAPSLPITTTVVGTLIAAEMIKSTVAPDHVLRNWWDHHLGVGPKSIRRRWRPAKRTCGLHRSSVG